MVDCPFCRSNNLESPSQVIDRDGRTNYSVKCLNCRARGPYANTQKESEELWNLSGKK